MAIKLNAYRPRLMEKLAIPSEAEHYINAALEDSTEMFFEAVKDVAQAHQMAAVAKKTGVGREGLYRSLSKQGNPSWKTVLSVLNVVGLEIPGVRVRGATSTPVSGGSSSRRIKTASSRSRKGVASRLSRSYFDSATSAQLTLGFPPESSNVVEAGKAPRLPQPSASAKTISVIWIQDAQQKKENSSLVLDAMLGSMAQNADAAGGDESGGWYE
jgi:probable addiction module antidote protein